MALKPLQPPIETFQASVAPSFGGTYNTISLAQPMRWLGAVRGDVADMFVLARDDRGVDHSLSEALPAGMLPRAIHLEQFEGQGRIELGNARGGPSPQAQFIGPRLYFRPDELLAVPQRIRDSASSDEGREWLAALEIIEPTPHDESAGS